MNHLLASLRLQRRVPAVDCVQELCDEAIPWRQEIASLRSQ